MFKSPANYLNLYIDESGRSPIGDPKYRFFLVSAVLMTPEQNQLSNLLFQNWRKRYLSNSYSERCFHAVDFFEERNEGYRRQELAITKNFSSAIDAMIELFKYVDVTAETFYVDLQKLRTLMHIKQPPEIVKQEIDLKKHSKKYDEAIKEYRAHIQLMAGSRKEHMPLMLTLNRAFNLHSSTMLKLSVGENFPIRGYINFESLSTQDTKLLEVFHHYKDNDYIHGKNITGINFHTKSSLDSGIELADFISYISFQTLRSQHRLYGELPQALDKYKMRHIVRLRKAMREKLKVNISEVTLDYKKS